MGKHQCNFDAEYILNTECTQHALHKFVTFAAVLWKTTVENEEILFSEVCNCFLSKKDSIPQSQ